MIEIYLRERLLDDNTLKALVVDRIFPVTVRKDATFPSLVYRRVSGSNGYDLDGPDGLRTVTVEVRCWATDYTAARTLADHVRRIMDGYREKSSEGPFRRCTVTDGADEFEEIDDTLGVYAAVALVTMTYDEDWTEPN